MARVSLLTLLDGLHSTAGGRGDERPRRNGPSPMRREGVCHQNAGHRRRHAERQPGGSHEDRKSTEEGGEPTVEDEKATPEDLRWKEEQQNSRARTGFQQEETESRKRHRGRFYPVAAADRIASAMTPTCSTRP